MNYHRSYHYNVVDDRPMLGPIDDDFLQETVSNDGSQNDNYEYNEDYENEAKQLLDDLDNILPKTAEISVKQCDSLEKNHHDAPLPLWYKRKLESKIREAKDRLELLSNIVCYSSPSIAAHIKRIEQDHGVTFCKLDYPRHPSFDKPWTNSWKFNCTIKCKDTGIPNHSHTDRCESQVVLEHVDTGVSMLTSNICPNEYPEFVMEAVEVFQKFANENMRNVPFSDVKGASDTAYETTLWTGIKLVVRSNCENKLMIIVRGKKVGSLKRQIKWYFNDGPGRDSEVISVSCIDQTWSRNRGKIEPEHLAGYYKLKDRIGSVLIEYKPKINVDFNSIEAAELGKIIKDYGGLTMETTLLDIGCNFGVLSLLMSNECERVIGLNTMHSVTNELIQAEEVKQLNRIENVSFIGCDPEDVITKCSPLVKGYITVAVLNLATPYGKSKYAIEALRNIPSIWRVIIYGSYTKEYRQNINKLTTENDASGDHFFPMQGCILDKSPSADAFDIVILFERTSLIMPKLKLELLASGPTVNVKTDSKVHKFESLDAQELKPKLLLDRNQNLKNSEEKYTKSPPYSSSSSRSSRKYKRSPSPRRSARSPSPRRSHHSSSSRSVRSPSPRRFVRSPSPRRSHHSSSSRSVRSPSSRRSQRSSSPRRSQRSSSPRRSTATDRHLDRSVHKQKSHPLPPVHKKEDTAVYPSTNHELANEFGITAVLKEEILPPRNKNRSPPFSASEKPFEHPMPEKNQQLDKEKDRQQPRDKTPPSSYPSLSVKKEFQFSCSTPPRERPPSPPADTSLHIDATRVKEENDANWTFPSWTTIISEPEQSKNKEDSVLNSNTEEGPIDSVTVAPNYPANSSNVNCDNIPLPVQVKSEPVDFYEVPSQIVNDQNIPQPADFNLESVDRHNVSSQFTTDENVLLPENIKSEPVDSQVPSQLITGDVPLPVSSNSVPVAQHDVSAKLQTGDNALLPVTVKTEPVDSHDNSTPLPVLTVKSEPIDSSYDMPLPLPMAPVKSEPVDSFKVPSQPVTVKNEPQDMEISPNAQDIENMETPIRNPRPVSSCSNSVFANLDGFEFSLEANKSYMTRDDEIEIIGEKRSEQQIETKPKIKTEDEVTKVKSEVEENDDDLRTLIEQRKKILEKLGQEKETRHHKDLPRSYKRNSSRSPSSRSSRKHNRSPSQPPRRSARSPSPYRHRSPNSKRRRRSPHRSRRSPSPDYRRSRRSPTSPVRVKKEPHSPDRFKKEPFSSVSNRRGDRSRKSPSSSSSKREVYRRTSPARSSHDKRKRSRSKSPRRRKSPFKS